MLRFCIVITTVYCESLKPLGKPSEGHYGPWYSNILLIPYSCIIFACKHDDVQNNERKCDQREMIL